VEEASSARAPFIHSLPSLARGALWRRGVRTFGSDQGLLGPRFQWRLATRSDCLGRGQVKDDLHVTCELTKLEAREGTNVTIPMLVRCRFALRVYMRVCPAKPRSAEAQRRTAAVSSNSV
jgi:hypothetical protein